MADTPSPASPVRVWDPWVRLSHWTVAAGFFLAYFLTEDTLGIHVWLGYLVGSLILIRILWGFVGPAHARFSSFVPTPAALKRYLRRLARGDEPRYLGHNPLGGVMVVALLAGLALTVGTGLMLYGAEDQRGPLGGLYAQEAVMPSPVSSARADLEEDFEAGETHSGGEEGALEEWHEAAANLTLLLVGLHVLGVFFTGWRQGENLPRAMVTGRKRPL
ncbi:MAG TPA: cytochrome b/b6 domain-containing protein [Gammaproteobacteria bacterium]|nr:cytochrome b/b6 domain-containing protein [Gammaproteobacteria bacterium]